MALILTRAVAICPSHGLLACFLSRVPGGEGYQHSWIRKVWEGESRKKEGRGHYLKSGIGLGFTLDVPSEKAVVEVLYSSEVYLGKILQYLTD